VFTIKEIDIMARNSKKYSYISNGNKNMFCENLFRWKWSFDENFQNKKVCNFKVPLGPCQKLKNDLEVLVDFKRKKT